MHLDFPNMKDLLVQDINDPNKKGAPQVPQNEFHQSHLVGPQLAVSSSP